MINSIEKHYKSFVSNNFISYDNKQLETLNSIESAWKDYKKINLFNLNKKYFGAYVYGSVGIGKTFILNLFINYISSSIKFHFNHLMINVHDILSKKNDNELEKYVKNLSQNYQIILIDELHIFNIVDALLIKKIFLLFKKYKMFILITSNFKPKDLYKDGLQRSDFIPFIKYLENFFLVFHIDHALDYRRLMLNQSKTYFSPINKETSSEFNKLFEKFVEINQIHVRKLNVKSREIILDKCTSNIAYCSFDSLCNKNFGSEDYHTIAKEFSLIFLEKIPQFDNSKLDQCRRFISLIDMLYEQKSSIVILAEFPISQLCKINKLSKEFERTSSRLYEMTIIT